MLMKEHRLEVLLEKYYSGRISGKEEQELRDFLCGDAVFPGYEAEREIFLHYSESEKMPVPSPDFETRIIKAIDDLEEAVQQQRPLPGQITEPEQKPLKRYLFTFSGIAAAILLIISFWFFLNLFNHATEPEDTYTDPALAYAEAMKVLSGVSIRLNMAAEAVIPVSELTQTTFDNMRYLGRSLNSFNTGLRETGLQMPDTDSDRNKNIPKPK